MEHSYLPMITSSIKDQNQKSCINGNYHATHKLNTSYPRNANLSSIQNTYLGNFFEYHSNIFDNSIYVCFISYTTSNICIAPANYYFQKFFFGIYYKK